MPSVGTLRRITPRDLLILAALDRCPLTTEQLLRLSTTFGEPFASVRRAQERLRHLASAGFVHSWPYAIASAGASPHYYRLTRLGYSILNGIHAPEPSRRQFAEIGIAHQAHTRALADFIVRLFVAAHEASVEIHYFTPENAIRLGVGDANLFPDCAFQLRPPDGKPLNYVVELDNGTERIRTNKDIESLERKIRLYDLHQSSRPVFDPGRFVVLFVTTKSSDRASHILDAAGRIMKNPKRTLFLGTDLKMFLSAARPLHEPIFGSPIERGVKLVKGETPRGNSPSPTPGLAQKTAEMRRIPTLSSPLIA